MKLVNNDSRCEGLPIEDDIQKGVKDISLILYIISISYVVIASIRFIYYHKRFERLRKRMVSSTFLVVLGCTVQFHAGVLQTAIPVPCWLGITLTMLVIPLSGVAIPLRLAEFYNRHVFSQIILEAGKERNQSIAGNQRPFLDNDNTESKRAAGSEKDNKKQQSSKNWNDVMLKGSDAADTNKQDIDGELSNNRSVRISVRDVMKGVVAQYLEPGNLSTETKQTGETGLTVSTISPSEIPAISSHQESDNQTNPAISQGLMLQKSLKVIRYLSLTKTQFLISFIMLLPFLLFIIIDVSSINRLNPEANCYYCVSTPSQSLFIAISGVVFIVMGLLVSYPVRKLPDPFGVLSECKALLVCGIISILGYILSRYFPDGSYSHFTFSWFVYLGMLLGVFISTDYQIIIAQRTEITSRRSKKLLRKQLVGDVQHSQIGTQVSSIGPGQNEKGLNGEIMNHDDPTHPRKLKALLEKNENDKVYKLFEQHLVSEFSIELLRMYKDCEYFAENFFDMSHNTRLTRAKRLCNLYIESNSIMQVNLPHKLRSKILETVMKNQSVDDRNLFRECQHEILLMLHGSFRRFVKTSAYISSIAG